MEIAGLAAEIQRLVNVRRMLLYCLIWFTQNWADVIANLVTVGGNIRQLLCK